MFIVVFKCIYLIPFKLARVIFYDVSCQFWYLTLVETGQRPFLLFLGTREHSNGFVCSWEHINQNKYSWSWQEIHIRKASHTACWGNAESIETTLAGPLYTFMTMNSFLMRFVFRPHSFCKLLPIMQPINENVKKQRSSNANATK